MPGKYRSIGLEGVPELIAKFKDLDRLIDDKNVEDGLLKAAKIIQASAKAKAPVKTGNLRRGIVAKKFGKKRLRQPAVFCGIDYRIAPHAHLVEYGHIAANGKHVGARPFFRRAVDESRGQVMTLIARVVKEAIEKEAKK